jgi:hypothetical protein
MKFYKHNHNSYYIRRNYNYRSKISDNKLTAVYHFVEDYSSYVQFFKNGKVHNSKNAAYIYNSGYKEFSLNAKFYGDQDDFTKQLWRRFTKLQAFL